MKSLSCYLYLCGILSIIACCCEKNSNNYNSISDNLLKKWVLQSIQDTKTNQISQFPKQISSKVSVTFTDSLSLSFSGICNGGKASYTLKSDSIRIYNMTSTQIFCGNPWEEYFANNLDSAFKYKIDANQLIIYSKGKYNLIFAN
jgi:heat shock protein HslJ